MGCGSSSTHDDKVKSLNKRNDGNPTMIIDKYGVEDFPEMTGTPIGDFTNLENNDLLQRFLSRPRVVLFIEKYILKGKLIEKEHANNFENLFQEIKPEFDDLFDRYRITYFIPEEHCIVDVKSYKLECIPSLKINLDLFLPLFFFEFCLYPKSFIKNSKVKCFIFVNAIQFSTADYSQYRAACPEYNQTFSLYYSTKERSITYIRQVLHHEFFHYVDWTDDFSYEDKLWRTFNQQGFEYGKGGAYERKWKPLDPESKGFINHYSTTGIEEDKAEIFQFIMSSPDEAFNHKDEIVRKKVHYLYKWLCKYDNIGMGRANYLGDLFNFRYVHSYP